MTDKLTWIDEELANLKQTGFYNTIPKGFLINVHYFRHVIFFNILI